MRKLRDVLEFADGSFQTGPKVDNETERCLLSAVWTECDAMTVSETFWSESEKHLNCNLIIIKESFKSSLQQIVS
jgi:hypothetical protein